MKELKFNYCIPREYKDKEGNINYFLCKGGEKMSIATINDIQTQCDTSKPKNAQPWCQVFSNGYRVTSDNIDWNDWNGVTFSDIDSKLFYEYKQKFDVNLLHEMIHENAQMLYYNNYYGSYITPSGKGYRILWFWKCDHTKENFLKCAKLTEDYTRELFYTMGEQTKEIIDFVCNKKKVLDSCSKSIMQGLYITKSEIKYSELTETDQYGACNIEDISLSELYESAEKIKLYKNQKQNAFVKFTSVEGFDKQELHYYPHYHRRCIYDALIVLFHDKEKVDEEWMKIANVLPTIEDNGDIGHNTQFFIEEPKKNKWFERFNDKVIHSLSWLDAFGYKFEDKSEYVYWRHFRKSWKAHITSCVRRKFIETLALDKLKKNFPNEIDRQGKKWDAAFNMEIALQKEIHKEDLLKPIFDNVYDMLDDIDEFRKRYYNTRWKRSEFKYLCTGYTIGQDANTYKMYADFHYRDENNLPIIKYNILEDDILTYGYDFENSKMQYHTLKFNDEYTHWCNNDEFTNKMIKEKMFCGISKYATRWHGFHSIKDYLNSLDLSIADENLLETWAIRYFKADDTKYVRTISKNFFIAAVKKMMIEDPTKFVFQHILFLQGPTGCGKTFFLVNMFTIDGHSYILNKIDPNANDKEIGPLVSKNWLIQFGESENLKKVSVNAQKEFVDRINLGMKYQKKFENEQTTVYPRVVVCRTSNDDTLFNDSGISEGDRRNWLIVCNCEAMSCDEKMKKQIRDERDILWATAYKMYLDNPDIDLELSIDEFKQLASKQEEFKMIKNSDIQELYDEVFERMYFTNNKCHIQDEYHFLKMLERSDASLKHKDVYVSELLDNNLYIQEHYISAIPANWLRSFVINKYGVNHWTLFKKFILCNGWEYKKYRYNDKPINCYVKR